MLVNRFDINQTNALLKTGRAVDHEEIELLAHILSLAPPNPVVVDVGANMGTYALRLAAIAGPGGRVHAFEPQRVICNMLAGSVALNGLTNVICHNVALGDREGEVALPQFDYSQPLNFGSVEFGPEQTEKLHQARGHDPAQEEFVPLMPLDRWGLQRLDLIKIDAEGMEVQILDGAAETLARCRPVIYVEFLKSDQKALHARLAALNCHIYQAQMNYLGIPAERFELVANSLKIRVDSVRP
jgi:FkbM family methyltransferase